MVSVKITPLPLLCQGKVYCCREEERREKGWEREGMDSARLNCNWSHQVQLGVEVIYRINKKRALTAGAD